MGVDQKVEREVEEYKLEVEASISMIILWRSERSE